MDGELHCPLCGLPLKAVSDTCSGCGLWWCDTSRDWEAIPGTASKDLPVPWVLALREQAGCGCAGVVSIFALYGGMAALFLIHSVLQSPRAWLTWLGFLVGVPLGGLLGVFCTGLLLRMLLHATSPSRLEGDPSGLRVKVWNTWNGLNFRRTDVRVPIDQLQGVGLKTGQGGQSLLFVLHSSGLSFGTGWSGSKEEANQLGGRLADWIATARARGSQGSGLR